jgi:hypothetical protein
MLPVHKLTRVEAKRADVVNAYWQPIYELAMWMTNSRPQAETLAAMTFRKALDSGRIYLGEHGLERELVMQVREMLPDFGEITIKPDFRAGRVHEFEPRIWAQHLSEIPPTERLAFVLHAIHGHDFLWLEEVMGMSDEAVRQAYHFGHERLRELLVMDEQNPCH